LRYIWKEKKDENNKNKLKENTALFRFADDSVNWNFMSVASDFTRSYGDTICAKVCR
jgi:hypothetical protein